MDDYLLGYYSHSLNPKYQFLNGNFRNHLGYFYDKEGRNIRTCLNLKTFILILKLDYFYNSGIVGFMKSYMSILKYYNLPLE